MFRHLLVLLISWLSVGTMPAQSNQPVVEIQGDRAVIFPQRMALTGEESLLDVLLMMPELLVAGYEDVIQNYNLRIDNAPMNGDARLILSRMKAKDIAKVQVCDNTGVAKGTIGTSKVLDINMKMPDTLEGFVEGQAGLGKDVEGIGVANALYGSRHTDVYANVSYRHHNGNEEFLTLHTTNRFDDRNRLLAYFTQQYLDRPDGTSRKVMGRARYFHTFNSMGTELLLSGSYQYASDAATSNQLPIYVVELNTPLLTRRLTMMLGAEGDFLITKQKDADRSWQVFNNDIYLQLTYALPKWRLTVGNRVMFYNYKLKEAGISQKYDDTRNNTNACVVYVPDSRHQVRLGYYRKYLNPVHAILFMVDESMSDEEWAITKGELDERTVNQVKLLYAYSRQQLTVMTEASYFAIEEGENFAELGASAYWKANVLTLTGGANLYAAKSGAYATFRLASTASLTHDWQIGAQVVCQTKRSPRREATGVPVYGCLSVDKLLGSRWRLGVDWHDMFDAFCSTATVNRHAASVRAQYRF